MIEKINNSLNLLRNMGWRYTQFRIKHELLRRTGLSTKKFPVSPPFKQYISLGDWKNKSDGFFFKSKDALSFPKKPVIGIEERFHKIKSGEFIFFNSNEINISKDYDWVTNPDTGFKYNVNKHWTEIADYSEEAGDIKYVWEKSRFSYLYDIIRYDYHFNEDCSSFVFSEILSWIKSNPVNQGPNYRCSQEISLRVLNWTFALHYYRNSTSLTDDVFDKIQFAIFWQMDHVYKNIDFSRIAVRNNHAITETLTLYLTGLLFPQYPGAASWKQNGKKWFEEEIAYQVYEDGTFLQFSMNYHRVVIQLLNWAIVLAEKNNELFAPIVFERAKRSLEFLRTCMIDQNGYLPNYGANDGALFFKLNDAAYRDYRPQLNALATALKIDLSFPGSYEDIHWYGLENKVLKTWKPADGIHRFNTGGYYIIREPDTLTFIRCGKYKDRPSQADNLHLDIWYNGENILMDAGSYKYNTDEKTLRYFMGTASHNTVMLGDHDQMKKGPRFIWYNWSQCTINTELIETKETFRFKGTISAFEHVANGILHTREVIKTKGKPFWYIKDTIANKPYSVSMKQLWHLPNQHSPVLWTSIDKNGQSIVPENKEGHVSELYGKKEACEMIVFQTDQNIIHTEFEIK
ncbi:MAG: heparinase II/III family protein [Bacteroidota bacterium]|nr:heparinase II/III family protein [Bacteroidota bacterium]